MKDLIIVGAGGFGRELLQIIKEVNKTKATWNIKGFIDDNLKALDKYECDYEVIGTIKDYSPSEGEVLACAVANPMMKESIIGSLKLKGATFTSIVHPDAMISDFVELGKGLIVYRGAMIGPNVKIGDFVTLLSAGIGHDAQVGDYSTISSFCDITGGVALGKRVFLSSRVSIIPNRKIGDDVYACAGSVIMNNVRKGSKVMGYPAKKFSL
ncbi:NeuD/PglB/VioB family sugar acetyltransferase [Hominibacterium faecale]|uniref:NeuD/PglB/VioB family sugar acetyltransferase n=1 Tax=Hominibacterium faecale TaxID=2839743 RepID=UPI0022B2A17B|nr:NeuD/PglB/VioB family sugar acetyltransferase [Hominibacterium faecale]